MPVSAGRTGPAGARSNLALRLLTAALGLPLLLLAIWFGGWPFAAVVAAIAFVAALEFLRGWLLPESSLLAVAKLWVVPAAAAATVVVAHRDERLVGLGAFTALICASLGYAPLPVSLERRLYRVFFWCLIYTGLLLAAGVLLRDSPDGRDWLLVAILATFATDTGAYATGRTLGRRPLAPNISPSKAIEGAVGGLISGAAAVAVLGTLLPAAAPVGVLALLGVLIPVGSQVGVPGVGGFLKQIGIKD